MLSDLKPDLKMSKKFGKKNPGGGHNSNSFRMSEKPLDGEYFLNV